MQHFNVDKDTTYAPILTLEGITNTSENQGILCARICVWRHGKVIVELDPVVLLHNLSQPCIQFGKLTMLRDPQYRAQKFTEILCSELHSLKHFSMHKAVGYIRLGGGTLWRRV